MAFWSSRADNGISIITKNNAGGCEYMLLEGVHVCFFLLFYSYTQVFY